MPVPHGTPLRLRVETQLGLMMVKYIQQIEFIADYRSVGHGQGGWREDYQFYSPEAGIQEDTDEQQCVEDEDAERTAA